MGATLSSISVCQGQHNITCPWINNHTIPPEADRPALIPIGSDGGSISFFDAIKYDTSNWWNQTTMPINSTLTPATTLETKDWFDVNAGPQGGWFYNPDKPEPLFQLTTDGDIAGLGVFLSFTFISGFLLTLGYAVMIRGIWKKLFSRKRGKTKVPNRFFDFRALGVPAMIYSLELGLSDAQIFTGFAMYGALRHQPCLMNAYHYQVVCWIFAIIVSTSSTSVTSLIAFFAWKDRAGRWKKRRIIGCLIRVALLLTLVILGLEPLWYAMHTPSGFPRFPEPLMGARAVCFTGFDGPSSRQTGLDGYARPFWMTLGAALFSIVVCILKVLADLFIIAEHWIKPIFLFISQVPAVVCYGYAIYYIRTLRGQAREIFQPDENEDFLGFGQIVPLILLALPFVSLLEAAASLDKEEAEEEDDDDDDNEPLDRNDVPQSWIPLDAAPDSSSKDSENRGHVRVREVI